MELRGCPSVVRRMSEVLVLLRIFRIHATRVGMGISEFPRRRNCFPRLGPLPEAQVMVLERQLGNSPTRLSAV